MRKLAEMEEYLQQDREFAVMSLDDYSSDWKAQRIVERTLHIMNIQLVDFLLFRDAILDQLPRGASGVSL
jgi:hypothetical protein